jgi:hypothetical protein
VDPQALAKRVVLAATAAQNTITFEDQNSGLPLETLLADRDEIAARYGKYRLKMSFGAAAFLSRCEVVQEILDGKR